MEIEIGRMRDESNRQHELTLKLIEQLGQRETPPQTSLTDLITAVKALKDTTQPQQSGVTQLTELVGLIKMGVELGATGGMPEKGWIDHLKDAAKLLPDALAAMKTAQPAQAQPNNDGGDPRVPVLRGIINYLKPKALAGSDVGGWVFLAMENVSDPKWAPLVQLVNAPYEEIAKVDEDLLKPQYRHWFESLFNGIKQELINASVSDDRPADGTVGDEDHPGENGVAGPGQPAVSDSPGESS
jgi:hypothetical protein